MEDKITQDIIVDTLIERPIPFIIGKKRWYIYPVTLGKSLLLSALIKQLGINKRYLEESPLLETMRVCSVNKEVACTIIAYAVCKTKDEIMDIANTRKLTRYFMRQSTDNVASLVNTILAYDRTAALVDHFGIGKDIENMRKVQRVKGDGNDMSFCGRSVWGQLIDTACERYGWTMEYVLWGISYNNLQMLITDQVKTIFLTDEERKKVHVAGRNSKVNKADDMTEEEIKNVLHLN